jgi:hypothetical protein
MLINSVESLVRNGYQIHVTTSGEVYVYFTTDSQARQHEVWDRDKALIDAFLGGRYISDYCYMSIRPVAAFFSEPVAEPAPVPTPKSTASKSAHKPVVAESVAESVVDSTPHVPNTPAFKPELGTLPEPPAQSSNFLEVLSGADDEYIVYAKTDDTFHIHWKIDRDHAKEVWRRDRSHIQQWLGADVLNTVSWEESSAKAHKATKWKEISAEQTKVRTVVRQLVAFGKPVADLAQLSDGSYHVYFHLPKEEAKQIYSNIKAEFADYEIASVSFE